MVWISLKCRFLAKKDVKCIEHAVYMSLPYLLFVSLLIIINSNLDGWNKIIEKVDWSYANFWEVQTFAFKSFWNLNIILNKKKLAICIWKINNSLV